MKSICTNNALKSSGHYSQAIINNDLVYISTQLAIDPSTGETRFGSFEEETGRILLNIETILKEIGANRNNILKTTVYITDITGWESVNKAYGCFFNTIKPARTIIAVNGLHFGAKVGIEAIATVAE